jgi:hypothetical protein
MPFQSEKQKKWMWANKPEMAREWTQEYGSKVKAKTGTMAKKDDKWIQKATKNMRKDKPCTGKKFGSPTCPPGSRRYNLAKTFRKMNKAATGTMVKAKGGGHPVIQGNIERTKIGNKRMDPKFIRKVYELANKNKVEDKLTKWDIKQAEKTLLNKAGGGPIKAKHGDWIQESVPHADIMKYVERGTGKEDTRGKRVRAEGSELRIRDRSRRMGQAARGMSKKKPKKIILSTDGKLKVIGDEARGGQGFTPGWKPHLSVKTAKKGTFSSIDTDRLLSQMKVRHGGGLPKATKYKKYLKSLGKATSSRFPSNVFTAGKTALGEAQLKAHLKTKLPKGATSLAKAARIAKATRYGKIALGIAGAGLAAKEYIKHKSKKKVQKKSTGGEIIIGRGVDMDLL